MAFPASSMGWKKNLTQSRNDAKKMSESCASSFAPPRSAAAPQRSVSLRFSDSPRCDPTENLSVLAPLQVRRDARRGRETVPHGSCVLGVLAPWRETIENCHDRGRHRQRDRGRRLSYPHHSRPGLLESVYHAVLAYELAQRGLRTVSQQAIPVVYGTIRIEIVFQADLIVEDRVIVAIKSVEVL